MLLDARRFKSRRAELKWICFIAKSQKRLGRKAEAKEHDNAVKYIIHIKRGWTLNDV